MFKHGKTGKQYYSVREKINYYKGVIAGKIQAPAATKRKAKARLKTLTRINNCDYKEPTLIVTDDKRFGNEISKPRVAVVVKQDYKGRLLVAPVNRRDIKTIILDKAPDRQITPRLKALDRSDVYEMKYVSGAKPLTVYDKRKIKEIYKE